MHDLSNINGPEPSKNLNPTMESKRLYPKTSISGIDIAGNGCIRPLSDHKGPPGRGKTCAVWDLWRWLWSKILYWLSGSEWNVVPLRFVWHPLSFNIDIIYIMLHIHLASQQPPGFRRAILGEWHNKATQQLETVGSICVSRIFSRPVNIRPPGKPSSEVMGQHHLLQWKRSTCIQEFLAIGSGSASKPRKS